MEFWLGKISAWEKLKEGLIVGGVMERRRGGFWEGREYFGF